MPKAGNAAARNDLPLDTILAGDCVEVMRGAARRPAST